MMSRHGTSRSSLLLTRFTGYVMRRTASSLRPASAQSELIAPKIAPVSAVLRLLLLERVVPVRGGGYMVTDTAFRACIFCTGVLVFQLTSWTIRYITVRDQEEVVLYILFWTDLFVSVAATLQAVGAIALTAREPSDTIVAYCRAVIRLDELLAPDRPRASDLARYRARCFYFTVPKIVYLIIEMMLWVFVYGWMPTWHHSGDAICFIISELGSLSHACRLMEVENRAAVLAQRLREMTADASHRSSILISGTASARTFGKPQHRTPRHMAASTALECYLLLCEMCDTIDHTFALQVVVCCLRGFTMFSSAIYEVVTVFTRSELYVSHAKGYIFIPMVMYTCDAALVVLLTVMQVQHAASVVRKRRDITQNAEALAVQDTKSEAWLQLVSLCSRRPLQFNACNFFKVDYSLLASMFGAIISYTVILIQMNNSSRNKYVSGKHNITQQL